MQESYIQTLKPTIWIGKNGCSEDIVEEVRRQLDSRKIIKIKWLQNCEMEDAEVLQLAKLCAADILDTRGRMVVFGAKNRGKEAAPAGAKRGAAPKQTTASARARAKLGLQKR
ncbi:MAG TPA: YhbY family RNA-binding protein [Methanocorpusculum sp.]|nr:YhbY family RNA-binding protein [Methanocorpusculum sp.]